MVWKIALKFFTRLEYEYAQVTKDLLCENATLLYCLVMVCNYISLFFLYLKECVVILEIESTVSCGRQEGQGFQSTEPFLNVHIYWIAWNVPSLLVTSSPDVLLAVKTQCCMEDKLFVYHKCTWVTRQSL